MHTTAIFHNWLATQRAHSAVADGAVATERHADALELRPTRTLLSIASAPAKNAFVLGLRARAQGLLSATAGAASISLSIGLFGAGVISSVAAACFFWVGIALVVGGAVTSMIIRTPIARPTSSPAEVFSNKLTQDGLAGWVNQGQGAELATRRRVQSRILAACENRNDGRLVIIYDLNMKDTGITQFPPGLTHFGASLSFTDCIHFTGFDDAIDSLSVAWDLSFSGCVSLRRLPKRLTSLSVGNHLDFDWCPRFCGFPRYLKNRSVGGYLMLSHCRGNIDVDAANAEWRREDGSPSIVEVSMSQLSGAVGDRLRRHNPIGPADPQFEFRLPERINAEKVELQRYLNYWHHSRIVGPIMRFASPGVDAPQQYGPPMTSGTELNDFFESPLCRFLKRLRVTAEYWDVSCRRNLSDFVVHLLHAMFEDEGFYRLCVDRMTETFMSCSDATILVKSYLEEELMVRSAVGGANDDAALRTLAKAIVKLRVVREHAARRHEQLGGDDVEIHLAFEIALTQRLALPLTTTRARHTRLAHVPDEAIEQAYMAALAAEQDEARVNELLSTWNQWRAQATAAA